MSIHLRDLLKDKERNSKMQISYEDILFDYSHEKITKEEAELLVKSYKDKNIKSKFEKMFNGEKINFTEKRSVLHSALRKSDLSSFPEVKEVLDKIKSFSSQVRSGEFSGHTGKKLINFVSIGIGGSYLGGEFVYQALKDHRDYEKSSHGLNLRFLANVCPIDFKRAFDGLNPENTLVIVISKTFTTKETMLNAISARDWILKNYPIKDKSEEASILSKHFIACSTNLEETNKFGIDSKNVFGFWDWVGGRYSVWSAVGAVPLSLIFGYDVFEKFLRGGESIDKHLLENIDNPEKNIPIMLGLVGWFNVRKLNISSRAILPYCQALSRFPAHIQQVDMESNGKQVNSKNEFLNSNEPSAPIVFGEPGTNGQHSFYQLIHQGRDVACEFIGYALSQKDIHIDGELVSNHEELMSNFFAQPDALANGLFKEELNCSEELKNHKTFNGDKSSLSLLFKELDAYSCGQLLSIYEHRIATEGFLYDVNSFDQYGVELGKVLAGDVRNVFIKKNKGNSVEEAIGGGFNSGTRSLLEKFIDYRK